MLMRWMSSLPGGQYMCPDLPEERYKYHTAGVHIAAQKTDRLVRREKDIIVIQIKIKAVHQWMGGGDTAEEGLYTV